MHKDFFTNKKILVTGASGVIGLNLCSFLAGCGCKEIHINYVSELDPVLIKILDNRFVHKRFDICDIAQLQKLDTYDVVFYCSGYGQPKKFTSNPYKTFHLNIIPLLTLTEKIKDGGHFLYVSTSEVYVNSIYPSEDADIIINPNNPRNCYILGKLAGEYYLELKHKEARINCKSVRVCLAYGPGFKPDDVRAMYEIIRKGTQGDINMMDGGDTVRRHVYIDDAIKMMINILVKGKEYLYNLGGIEEVSVLELTKKIGVLTKAKVNVGKAENKLKGSPKASFVDISKYQSEFGNIDFVPLEVGLSRCVDWYLKYKREITSV